LKRDQASIDAFKAEIQAHSHSGRPCGGYRGHADGAHLQRRPARCRPGRRSARRRSGQGRLRHLGVGERAQVLAGADDFLRQAETGAAATKSRLWLNHPASPRQRELLVKAGDADPALDFGLSKYAANCRLNFLWHRPQVLAAVFPGGLGRAA
jgi:hypothetical protein